MKGMIATLFAVLIQGNTDGIEAVTESVLDEAGDAECLYKGEKPVP